MNNPLSAKQLPERLDQSIRVLTNLLRDERKWESSNGEISEVAQALVTALGTMHAVKLTLFLEDEHERPN